MKLSKISRARGFSLVETMFSMFIVALGSVATLSALAFNQAVNSAERERAAAHEIISARMEALSADPWSAITNGENVTIVTLNVDGTEVPVTGTLTIKVYNASTGVELLAKPAGPSVLKQVEVSLTWQPSGSGSARTQTETLIAYQD